LEQRKIFLPDLRSARRTIKTPNFTAKIDGKNFIVNILILSIVVIKAFHKTFVRKGKGKILETSRNPETISFHDLKSSTTMSP